MDIEELKAQLLAETENAKVKEEEKKVKEKNVKQAKKPEKTNSTSEEKVQEEIKYIKQDLSEKLAKDLNINIKIVKNILEMIEEGNTIPFIARYRKERTGGMDDDLLREFEQKLKTYTNLLERKEEVARLIDEQGKLTEEILKAIEEAETLSKVEDIYRPYKGKKKTRGTEARRKGLEGLSIYILEGKDENNIYIEAAKYLNEEVLTEEEAISGAKDIIAEDISDDAEIREELRKIYLNTGKIVAKKGKEEDEKQVYKMYYEFEDMLKTIPSHRYLAIARGEKEKKLSVSVEIDEEKEISKIVEYVVQKNKGIKYYAVEEIVRDSFKRLIVPSVEREVRQVVKERSDEYAIDVFGTNLKELLMGAPLKNVRILGYDPGFRNGSKLACIDESGKFIDSKIIHVTMNEKNKEEDLEELRKLISRNKIDVVAIGNGTASRESEKIVSEIISGTETKYIIVSEAGASIYSASKLAAEEFPDVNVSIRGAISIARRLQDPLSELVKIDPKSIGVGQYQHDVNQTKLEEKLYNVVEDSVNKVGVDLNTATFSLISYVSGLTKKQAKAIVKYREEKGKYSERKEILKVSGIGEKAFTQAAGFLRIYEGKNALELTGIHPESYELAEKILKYIGAEKEILKDTEKREEVFSKLKQLEKDIDKLIKTEEFNGYGKYELEDTIKEMIKPGIDIRDELPKPILRNDILDFEDIQVGMKMKGTVRNVAAFGAFVDIGIHDDGLVHISEMSNKFIKDPKEIVKVGDIVDVIVIEKDEERHKVKLSMKNINE